MATRVLVPQLGEGVEEVTILQWLVNEGDSVEEYDGLVEVETDKVVTEIPSPTTGSVLKIEIPEQGSIAPVGVTLAWLGEPGEAVPDSDPDFVNLGNTPSLIDNYPTSIQAFPIRAKFIIQIP